MPSSNDVEKLKILLPHWIKHNQEHAQEFRTWAERAEKSQQDFLVAAEYLDKASEALGAALHKLGSGVPLKGEHH
ncbi:MAG TPA: hypothetical protein G4O14_09690 [Anaerolineae bacterium]|nr:hypothetical protein [Anaerolineae bacterium]